MKTPNSGLRLDSPSWPLLQALISYWGVTTAPGNLFGTSIIDALCSTPGQQPNYEGLLCKLLDGGAAGQAQVVWAHNLATGELSFANPWRDFTGAVIQIPAGIRFVILTIIGGGGGPGPAPGGNYGPTLSLCETWQDELGIDFTIWTTTNPVGGVAWARGAAGAYLRASAAPNANNNARLRSNQRWIAAPSVYGTNTVIRKFYHEFEFRLTNVANIDAANALFGLTPGIADTRGSWNIIAWAIAAGVLQSVTDLGGAETVATGFGEVLTNWNKLLIEVSPGRVEFAINQAVVAAHVATLPDQPMYLNWYFPTGGGGPATIEIGIVRDWYEDVT